MGRPAAESPRRLKSIITVSRETMTVVNGFGLRQAGAAANVSPLMPRVRPDESFSTADCADWRCSNLQFSGARLSPSAAGGNGNAFEIFGIRFDFICCG
jgi:hypothetical protein